MKKIYLLALMMCSITQSNFIMSMSAILSECKSSLTDNPALVRGIAAGCMLFSGAMLMSGLFQKYLYNRNPQKNPPLYFNIALNDWRFDTCRMNELSLPIPIFLLNESIKARFSLPFLGSVALLFAQKCKYIK